MKKLSILGTNAAPNYFVGESYDEDSFLKNWIIERLDWMDENIPSCWSDQKITTFNRD